MPVYEYVCEKCQHTTELLRPMREADARAACARCGSEKTRRAHSVFSAAASGSAAGERSLPMAGCGRCGDPNGSCPFN